MSQKQPKIYGKSLAGLTIVAVLSVLMIYNTYKTRKDLIRVNGNIKHITSKLEGIPELHPGKARYLTVDHSDQIFELFVGKDAGDFKPAYEIVDSLKTGDNITVYYDELLPFVQPTATNQRTQFIDRNTQTIFIKGNSLRGLAWGLLTFSVGAIAGIYILFKKKKIS